VRVLIVFCHPEPTSYAATLLATARDALTRAGHELRLIDLYAEGFNPVLSAAEKATYLPNPALNVEGVRAHVDALRWAEALAFVFPTWFYGPPAMLKGWLERVWLPGVAFTVPEKAGGTARPGMQHITRLICVTTSGSPWWWLRVVRDPGRNLFTRGLRALFHPRCKTTWLQLHGMNTSTLAQREAFIGKVQHTLEKMP
jgi:NAD(P)H dehydrogenase (quinone)